MYAETRSRSYVIFAVGSERYGLPVDVVSGIIRYTEPTPVPHAAPSVTGVINLRGRVIPVVDLASRFLGEPMVPQATSRIVVAECESGPVGLAVDSANEVTALAEEHVRPVPDGVLQQANARAFQGVVEREEGELVILLDLNHAVPNAVPVRDGVVDEGSGASV